MTPHLAANHEPVWASRLREGIPCGKYILKIATSEEEKKKALKLRFDIFNIELSEGLPENTDLGLDVDRFDSVCDHLLVKFKDEVVGTYRLLHGNERPEFGFYTEGEFKMNRLIKKFNIDLKDVVELGRGCIQPEHRNQSTLLVLIWGLEKYLMSYGARYLFGCGSLPPGLSTDDADATYMALQGQGSVMEIEGVRPVPEYSYKSTGNLGDPSIPPLIRVYLQFGAKILSRPAYDKVFGCYDLLVVFDFCQTSEWGVNCLKRFDNRLEKSRQASED